MRRILRAPLSCSTSPFNAEAAAGMYKKPIELLAKEVHYGPLPQEIRVAIIAAWRRGSALPQATIEEMVPAQWNPEPTKTLETRPSNGEMA
jgi:hypothetical protein